MIFSPRISLGQLAAMCHRLAISLQAGVDVRTVWAREAERARGSMRRRLHAVSQAVDRGESATAALALAGDYFPTLLRELAEVGELTGHQAEVFAQLADHYQNQITLRRVFLASILWPMIQLTLAVLIIGFLIWIMGVIRDATGNRGVDPLGFGLVGNRGLAIYVAFVAVVVAVAWAAIAAVRRGLVWGRPIQRAVLRLPVLGKALETLALARLAWTMYLTMNAGMPIRRALALSLRSTHNARFIDQIPAIDAEIAQGNSIYEAFRQAGGYPVEFLDSLAVSEESGMLVESMARLSRQYQERARMALAALTTVAGFAVWGVIAAIIIFLIFRLFSFYIGTINDALKF